jgi:hypothetical protein
VRQAERAGGLRHPHRGAAARRSRGPPRTAAQRSRLGIRSIARELNVDRKTARRFAQALTADNAVARTISRPAILDRYQPHLHRRWHEGCHDAAVLHAEITALGYRGSLHTFAAGIRQDLAAVTAGLTLPYNSGSTEDNVNRLTKPSRGRCTATPPSSSANASSITLSKKTTEFAPEPITLASGNQLRANYLECWPPGRLREGARCGSYMYNEFVYVNIAVMSCASAQPAQWALSMTVCARAKRSDLPVLIARLGRTLIRLRSAWPGPAGLGGERSC